MSAFLTIVSSVGSSERETTANHVKSYEIKTNIIRRQKEVEDGNFEHVLISMFYSNFNLIDVVVPIKETAF